MRVQFYCEVVPCSQPECLYSKNTDLTDLKKWILITCVTHNPFFTVLKRCQTSYNPEGMYFIFSLLPVLQAQSNFHRKYSIPKKPNTQRQLLLIFINSFQSHLLGKLTLTSAWQINSTPRTNLCLSWVIKYLQEACIYARAGGRETRTSVTRVQPLGRDSCTHLQKVCPAPTAEHKGSKCFTQCLGALKWCGSWAGKEKEKGKKNSVHHIICKAIFLACPCRNSWIKEVSKGGGKTGISYREEILLYGHEVGREIMDMANSIITARLHSGGINQEF